MATTLRWQCKASLIIFQSVLPRQEYKTGVQDRPKNQSNLRANNSPQPQFELYTILYRAYDLGLVLGTFTEARQCTGGGDLAFA